MIGFDPNRILEMARVFETGTRDEKLDLIATLDPTEAVAVGVLTRALDDNDSVVRLEALKRFDEAGTKPMEPLFGRLLEDEDPEIREIAGRLADCSDTANPFDSMIPMIEQMADSLGPLGGILKSMIGSLRDVGAEDEKSQLLSVSKLGPGNPAAIVVINQALRSNHISVRIAALKKSVELEQVKIPEEYITQFLVDPSPDVRAAAEAAIQAGRVGPFDAEGFRTESMQMMLQQLLGATGMGGLGDLGGLMSNLMGGSPESTPEPELEPTEQVIPHYVSGKSYLVSEQRVRDRLINVSQHLAKTNDTPTVEELVWDSSPGRWAISTEPAKTPQPSWPTALAEAGLTLDETVIRRAETTRGLSEHIWGAAFADHQADPAFTLVFHDGILSRAEWSGDSPGAWSAADGAIEPSEQGPLALLVAYLNDPTDETLVDLESDPIPLENEE